MTAAFEGRGRGSASVARVRRRVLALPAPPRRRIRRLGRRSRHARRWRNRRARIRAARAADFDHRGEALRDDRGQTDVPARVEVADVVVERLLDVPEELRGVEELDPFGRELATELAELRIGPFDAAD